MLASPLFKLYHVTYGFFARLYHKNYHGRYRSAKKIFIFDSFLIFSVLFLFGAGLFLLLSKPVSNELIGVKIYLQNPKIKSGDAATVIVDYSNRSKYNLRDVALAVSLPAGFIINREQTHESVFSKKSVFNLSSIAPGARGRLEIHGQLWGELGVRQNFISLLSYRPENSSQTEQLLENFLWRAADSVLQTKFTLPATSPPGKNAPFVIILENSGSTALQHIYLDINWSMPVKGDFYNLTLYPKEKKTYSQNFFVPDEPNGVYTLQAVARVLVNGSFIAQSEATRTIKVVEP